ncbi:hypothetical protein ACH347_29920 [Saccharopolyspora sp. 5N102]|uniref:hypothetical protein n=1 Tax=Saccharopolyspora sp. 5N102 TaxID=3375155 RepID=UPI003789084E
MAAFEPQLADSPGDRHALFLKEPVQVPARDVVGAGDHARAEAWPSEVLTDENLDLSQQCLPPSAGFLGEVRRVRARAMSLNRPTRALPRPGLSTGRY